MLTAFFDLLNKFLLNSMTSFWVSSCYLAESHVEALLLSYNQSTANEDMILFFRSVDNSDKTEVVVFGAEAIKKETAKSISSSGWH